MKGVSNESVASIECFLIEQRTIVMINLRHWYALLDQGGRWYFMGHYLYDKRSSEPATERLFRAKPRKHPTFCNADKRTRARTWPTLNIQHSGCHYGPTQCATTRWPCDGMRWIKYLHFNRRFEVRRVQLKHGASTDTHTHLLVDLFQCGRAFKMRHFACL